MSDTLLFLDTETTGFSKSGSMIQEGQARVCQVAMILADGYGRTLAEFSCLIDPNGWVIGEGAFRCHGISQHDCITHGVPQSKMVDIYLDLTSKASMIVAHNSTFDKKMMDIEVAYFNNQRDETKIMTKQWFCTQNNAINVCCIPPTQKMVAVGRTHFKTPSLAEALMHFTGKQIEGAHDAMVDTRACRDIFFAMRGITL